MLQKFNERIQGIVAWVIIGIVAFTFTLFGIDSYLQSHHASSNEVEVNGQPISKQAFELQYRRVRQTQEASTLLQSDENVLKQQILDDMIAMEVNKNAAATYGFGLDASIANTAILQIPEFQKDGHFSQDKYQQALSNAFFTPQTFLDEVRQGMLLNQQRFAFMGTSFALPGEVEQFVKLFGQTRDYRYVRIPSQSFLNQSGVSDEETIAYYKSHQADFLTPELVSLEVVKLSMAKIKDGIKPTDKELKAYYEANQGSYMTPAKWLLRHAIFEDSKEANNFFESMQASPEAFKAHSKVKPMPNAVVAGESEHIDATLLQLTEAGDIAGPVKTPAGYEVFQLVSYEKPKAKPFETVIDEVRIHLVSDKVQVEYARLHEILAEESYQTPDALAPVAQALGLPTEKTILFSKAGGNDALTKAEPVIRAAFSHDVLTLGNNSQPIQLDEDTIVVLRVDKHQAAEEKPLTSVREEIQEKLRAQKTLKLAEQLGEQLIRADANHPVDESVFTTNGIQWQRVTQASRDSSLATPEINQLAFSSTKAKPRTGAVLPDGSGYVVVELQKVVDGKLSSLDSEQISSIRQQISANFGSVDYDIYVNNLIEKAKIVRH